MLVGLVFALAIAPGLVEDLEARCRVIPKAEEAHWFAAAVALLIGLLLVAELIVGQEVFRKRAWRAYLFPAVVDRLERAACG